MMQVNWTKRAEDSLNQVFEYIHQDAPWHAVRFVQHIFDAVDRLEQFPLSGRLVPEAERDDIREIIYQDYRIIYWVVHSGRVDILTVMHGSRDLTHPDNRPWGSP